MQVAALFLHALDERPCPGWVLRGSNWTPELQERANGVMSKFIKKVEFPGFNYWSLITDGKGWVLARRFTWDMSSIGGSWEKLEKDLESYYARFQDDMD